MENTETKVCSKCGLNKLLTEYRFLKTRGSFRGECRVCEAEKIREYRVKNRDTIINKQKIKWRDDKNNEEYMVKRRQINFLSRVRCKEKTMWKCAKDRAEKYNIPFDITIDDIVIPDTCPILGIKIDRENRGMAKSNSPSLDRVNPSKGYIRGNICVISHRANQIKNNGDAREHRLIADFIDKWCLTH